jgi:hypothetical protein
MPLRRATLGSRSPTWRLDRRTVARIRVSAIWKRHPEFSAKQVLANLGPKHSLSVRWVQQILTDCWQASGAAPDRPAAL